MAHDIIFFLLGLVLIIAGGNYLTDGASAIARRFNISELVIGVTIVAFGSSTPDLVVCLTSTLAGHSQLALGDVVGANIFDLLLVTGIVALIHPIAISTQSKQVNLPMLALSSLALFFCADDILFDNMTANRVDRTDGLLLLTFFIIFMVQTLRMGRNQQPTTPPPSAHTPDKQAATHKKMWLAAVMVAGGLAALIIGGNWIVDGASGIARHMGLPEGLIGLTIVGIGSSVPDLATSVIAACKKEPGIALGNIVGSCIINVFLIIGLCSTVKPLDAGTISSLDFGTLAIGGILVWIFGETGGKHGINRIEGAILTACYVAYAVKLVMSA